MSSEHVEVLWAMLRKYVYERLARKSADREADALAAAIAALSAPQPPAGAQPVAWLSDWKHAANGGVTRDADIAAAWEARGEVTPLYAHPPPSAPVGVEELVRDLVREIEHNTCTHEETHRGGSIWEICDACGAKWADDRGGKPDFKWPDCVERAHSWLAQRPAAVDGAMVERLAQAVATELYGEPPQPGSNSLTRAMMLPGIKRALTATLAAQQGGTQE